MLPRDLKSKCFCWTDKGKGHEKFPLLAVNRFQGHSQSWSVESYLVEALYFNCNATLAKTSTDLSSFCFAISTVTSVVVVLFWFFEILMCGCHKPHSFFHILHVIWYIFLVSLKLRVWCMHWKLWWRNLKSKIQGRHEHFLTQKNRFIYRLAFQIRSESDKERDCL